MLVGFNPQPEPPGIGVPTASLASSVLTATNVVTDVAQIAVSGVTAADFDPVGSDRKSDMEIVLFFDDIYAVMGIDPTPFNTSVGDRDTQFELHDGSGLAFTVKLFTSTLSGGNFVGDPLSVVGFNPQPEPPGTNGIGFLIDNYNSYSSAILQIQIEDAAGNNLVFSQISAIPEPGAVELLALGLFAFLSRRRFRSARLSELYARVAGR